MSKESITIGLIGAGPHVTENILPVFLNHLPVVSCVWVVDPDINAARECAARFRGCRAGIDWREEVDRQRPSAVFVIATPQVHHAVATYSLSAKIPCFCEKPPAVDLAQMIGLATLAEDAGISTMVGHNLRHSEASLQLAEVVRRDDFGHPLAIDVQYCASKPRGDRWGLESPIKSFLLSHVSHALDFMVSQMGPIHSISSAASVEWADTVTITAQIQFQSRSIGNLFATSAAPHFSVSATIISSLGRLVNMRDLARVELVGAEGDAKRWGRMWSSRTLNTGYEFAGFQREIDQFLQSIRLGKPSLSAPSFVDEVEIYKGLEAIETAVRSGSQSVKV